MINVFTKYAWVKPFKNIKAKTVHHGFIKIIYESNRKPNKLWVGLRGELYASTLQKWLDDNDILMYSIHEDGIYMPRCT